jgi:hypothetical protein
MPAYDFILVLLSFVYAAVWSPKGTHPAVVAGPAA